MNTGRMRYFSGTEPLDRIDTMDNKKFIELFGNIKGKRSDSFSMRVGRNTNGVLQPVTRVIDFKANPSLHKCDARCLNAKGHSCECSCGGKNHGAGTAT